MESRTSVPGLPAAGDVAQEVGHTVVGAAALKALAHPLRIRLLEELSRYGAQTASGLATRLGESSGSTSYHLRQLAKHGLVREVRDRGTARERWWERPPGPLVVATPGLATSPATRTAARLVSREFERGRAQALAEFMDHGVDQLDPQWTEAAIISTSSLHLTVEQLREVSEKAERYVRSLAGQYPNEPGAEGTLPVQLHLNVFPLMDGRAAGPPPGK
ncbi:helix-turn-helix domain-containing protein [Arthrobacter sp. I2-34]|uniref:Helix-turn-helix domain-containing protein n=1 Tax=Arthrobacter hankyongi TaxID=2904801 RepID=A0ABS9L506_9MICC|nr:helix-turn-helix domain-containing protein [Arthrobacter hankyongi]MCG2621744.1 helix-turn-helix domain-containing protein [Arthrobacter hankyongi]